MTSQKDFLGKYSLESICTYLITDNAERIIRYESQARQQAEQLEGQVCFLMEKLVDDILSFHWESVTDAEASNRLYAMANDLDNVYYDLQVLYFKTGFESGFEFAQQLNNLCGSDS